MRARTWQRIRSPHVPWFRLPLLYMLPALLMSGSPVWAHGISGSLSSAINSVTPEHANSGMQSRNGGQVPFGPGGANSSLSGFINSTYGTNATCATCAIYSPAANFSSDPTWSAGVGLRSGSGAQPHVANPANGYSGSIYWYGAAYTGTNYTTSENVQIMYTSILVPPSGPRWNDNYFELLSAFDTQGYYDQIGIASNYCSGCQNSGNDAFTADYEQGWSTATQTCATAGNIENAAYTLSSGEWYTFLAYLTGSDVVFKVFSGDGNFNGTALWTSPTTFTDSSYSFELASSFTGCAGGYDHSTSLGFTDYQEVHAIASTSSMANPQWNVWFDQTDIAWWSGSAWLVTGIPDSSFTGNQCWHQGATCQYPAHGSPNGYTTYDYNRFIAITNVAMRLYWTQAQEYPSIASAPGSVTENGYEYSTGAYCPGVTGYCSVGWSCWFPSGWGGTDSGTSPLDVSQTDSYAPSAPSGTSPGTYYGGCTLTQTSSTPNEFTTFIFYITVG